MDTPEPRIIEAKTAISRARLPDAFFTSLYRVLAPYRGCAHGCAYCDGRAEKYYVEGDFARDISVRSNVAELSARDVAKGALAKEYGAVGIGSGVTDVYQPIEADLRLTRASLETLADAGVPIVILTKNRLILRDFDILARFPRALVIVTVTTVNAERAALLEPGASTPAERLEIVRRAKEAGFFSGIMAMPLCPGISDGEESFAALLDAAEAVGADFVYPGGLTLRPGRQKDAFISLIDASFPQLRPNYDELYRENRQSGMPLNDRAAALHARLDRTLRAREMAQRIPHWMHRELLSPTDSLFVLLCHMEDLFWSRGVDTKPLRAATGRYAEWLTSERETLRRKRVTVVPSDPFPITRILTEKLMGLAHGDDGLERLLGNAKLAELARAVVLGNGDFDYPTLRLGQRTVP